MTPEAVRGDVLRLLRQHALLGSGREVGPDDPLGPRVGLDSLALVTYLTALENRFGVQFPDVLWTERRQLTVRRLADHVVALRRGTKAVQGTRQARHGIPLTGSAWQKVGAVTWTRELWAGITWVIRRLAARVGRVFFTRQRFYLLRFDLVRDPIRVSTPSGITLRAVTEADSEALADFWRTVPDAAEERNFQNQPGCRYIRMAGWEAGTIAGLCLITSGAFDAHALRLRIETVEGTCWGQGLVERRGCEGRGVGLALLSTCVQEAKNHGFALQLTLVADTNVKMLASCVQLLGFEKVGGVTVFRLLGWPVARLRFNERAWWGRRLVV